MNPETKRRAVIGDVHGCSHTLEALLERLPADREEVYTVGDLIDRGPDSPSVIDLCIERGIISVMGNHEHMLLDYLDGKKIYGSGAYIRNGGKETLASYGGDVSSKHLSYMKAMPLYMELDGFFLSHAGVGVSQTIESACDFGGSIELGILWNRGGLGDMGLMQIVGHNQGRDVSPCYLEGKQVGLNIDTGCVYGHLGILTALLLPEMETVQVPCVD